MRGCSSSGISGASSRDCNSVFLASRDRSSFLIDSAETPSFYGLNELADFAFDGCELGSGARESRSMLHSQSIQLAHVLEAEVLEQVPAHQLLAERDEHAFFHLLAADRQA